MADKSTQTPRVNPVPESTAFVETLREAFGQEMIDDLIARGRAGEPVFFVQENGRSIGTKALDDKNVWRVEGIERRYFCPGCIGDCVGDSKRRCSHQARSKQK